MGRPGASLPGLTTKSAFSSRSYFLPRPWWFSVFCHPREISRTPAESPISLSSPRSSGRLSRSLPRACRFPLGPKQWVTLLRVRHAELPHQRFPGSTRRKFQARSSLIEQLTFCQHSTSVIFILLFQNREIPDIPSSPCKRIIRGISDLCVLPHW